MIDKAILIGQVLIYKADCLAEVRRWFRPGQGGLQLAQEVKICVLLKLWNVIILGELVDFNMSEKGYRGGGIGFHGSKITAKVKIAEERRNRCNRFGLDGSLIAARRSIS
jgi:hypothetical protein